MKKVKGENGFQMYNYVPLKLIVSTDKPEDMSLFSRSPFFTHAIYITRDHIVGRGAEDISRSKDLDIWTDILPKDGIYTFDFAVQLPFFMPKFKNADEYIISVNEREYIVSNRHCEVILNGKNDLYYFVHYLSYQELQKRLGSEINQVIMSKSIVITRFRVTAESASKAIEVNFEKWLSTLNSDIPLLINALRYHLDERLYDLPDCNDIAKFCPIYVICQGDKISVPLKFAAHIAANQIQSFTKFSCNISDIEDFCSGKKSIDTSKVILDKAQFLYSSGEFVMACILACIACETHLSDVILKHLRERGLSNSKADDAFNDLTFSQMINLLSYFITNMKEENTKNIIGKINALRKLRNDIIHEAKWVRQDTNDIIKSGIESIIHLKKVLEGAE